MTARLPFAEHVRRALDSLPPELARGLKNVAVVIEEQDPADPDLLVVKPLLGSPLELDLATGRTNELKSRQKPTVLNNVETFINVPQILAQGVDWFVAQGVSVSRGLKFVGVSGHVARPRAMPQTPIPNRSAAGTASRSIRRATPAPRCRHCR